MAMRLLAAVAVLVSAAVHLYLWWWDGYKDIDVVGPAFLLNGVGGVVISVLLLTWRHWIPAFLTLGFGLSTLGAFVISTTVGLFGVNETWSGWAVWTAAISEAVAIVTGLVLLAAARPWTLRSERGPRADHRLAH
jgi:hypothetical protein